MKIKALLMAAVLSPFNVMATPLHIIFDMQFNEYNNVTNGVSESIINLNAQYTLTLNTDQLTYSTPEENPLGYAEINSGKWTFDSKQSEIDNFRIEQPAEDGAIWTATNQYIGASSTYENWFFSTLDPLSSLQQYRKERLSIYLEDNLPAATNIENLLQILNSIKTTQQSFQFFHEFYSQDSITTCISLYDDECNSVDYINHYYYFGSARISNISVGEVPEVPIPSAAWLMGSGLLGLTAAARRKKI